MCEAAKVSLGFSAKQQVKFDEHMTGKAETHNERKKDRNINGIAEFAGLEFAGLENDGLEKTDRKMTDWKMTE